MNTRVAATEYRMAQWSQALQERRANGETIDKFCQRMGVSRHSYFYWQRKLRKAACEQLVKLQTDPTALAVQGFTEVKVAKPVALPISTSMGQVSVETGSYKVTADSGYPADKLAALLRELARSC